MEQKEQLYGTAICLVLGSKQSIPYIYPISCFLKSYALYELYLFYKLRHIIIPELSNQSVISAFSMDTSVTLPAIRRRGTKCT